MVQMRAGERKKLIILNTCKRLFYENGYNATTYEDICKAADIPPGSITYHFTGKKNIASIIHSEYELQVKTMMNIVTRGQYDFRVMTALELLNWWDRFFNDPKLRRFVIEINGEGIPRYSSSKDIEYFFVLHINEYKLDISEKKLKLIIAAHIGLVSELIYTVSENLSEYTSREVADYVIENDLKALNVDYETINEVIEKAHQVYDELNISNDYFKLFKYDTALLAPDSITQKATGERTPL